MKISVEEELLSTIQATLEATRIELANMRKMATQDDPFSIVEAAAYLKVSRRTFDMYISDGQITPSAYCGRLWVTRKELNAFVARNRRKIL